MNFGNKFIWGSWLLLLKKRQLFYNCHCRGTKVNVCLKFARDSNFELCWARAPRSTILFIRGRGRGQEPVSPLCTAHAPQPLPPGARAQGAAAPAGKLVQSAPWWYALRPAFRVSSVSGAHHPCCPQLRLLLGCPHRDGVSELWLCGKLEHANHLIIWSSEEIQIFPCLVAFDAV